jgi:hypothetical protein
VKKMNIILGAVAMQLMIVSCASVPKAPQTEQSVQPAPVEQPPETNSVKPSEQAAEPEKQVPPEAAGYSDLAEPVVPDILPEAAPVQPQPVANTAPASDSIKEPSVRDEPYKEKNAAPDAKAASPAASELPVTKIPAPQPAAEQKKEPQKTVEPAPVKRADNSTKQVPSAAPKQKNNSSAKKQAAAVPEKVKTPSPSVKSEPSSDIEKEKPVPSRSVTLDKNQYLDVMYPGTGWIYLGETDSTKNLIFFGRKLGETDTSFTLRARSTGRSLLHFYKSDVLTGKYIDDYLEVTVTDKNTDSQVHAKAPLYADAVPSRPSSAAAVIPENSSAAADTSRQASPAYIPVDSPLQTQKAGSSPATDEVPVKAAVQTSESGPGSQQYSASSGVQSAAGTASVLSGGTAAASTQSGTDSSLSAVPSDQAQNESADDLLKDIQSAYDAKQYEKAQSLLSLFFEKAVSRIDEGLYLQGLVLEAKSSIQNIKGAIDSYEILMKNWPDSPLWNKASQRNIYLHRMYIDIR